MEDYTEHGAANSYQQPGRLEMEAQQSVQGYIAIKGTKNGLLLTLEPETPFGELLDALARRLAEAPAFFRGAALSVDTSRRLLRVSERVQLEDLLAYYQMSVMPLDRASREHIQAAIEQHETREAHETRDLREAKTTVALEPLDLTPEPAAPVSEEMESVQRDLRESDDTLFLRRTVRSGQVIHHHSNVVVLGDVNAGAEIIAGGDIIVWGVLRGMAHAGYADNESAMVYALQLTPVQLRIAHLLSRPPEGFGVQARPEVATIYQGQIVVEAWVNGRPPRK